LVLSYDDFERIRDYCAKKEIEFLSTPFDLDSIDFLKEIGVRFWKIPSGEITNYPYMVKIAQTGMPIVMSTGMASLSEVRTAFQLLKDHGSGEISLLQCTTEYPAPIEDVNLRAMLTMKEEFGCRIGYSDHTPGIEIPIAAVAMGATIIEKHLTLDRNLPGPDHQASLEPDQFTDMVKAIRNVEKAMGNGEKVPSDSEKKNIDIARKSIVAVTLIRKGEIFTAQNITTKRPGNGISAMRWNEVLGKTAVRDFQEDELIEL
ncbi:MAG: N-acetylneuraminate synthase family protein, partial [Lachnospiraceae bacterium]|nr:N-acetylneuraminate synthase family protein [Lachnospiraceae bacterium]